MSALGVETGHTAIRTRERSWRSEVLRGGVALRRRRLPVDRLEYSHAGVPVAQGYAEPALYLNSLFSCDRMSSSKWISWRTGC